MGSVLGDEPTPSPRATGTFPSTFPSSVEINVAVLDGCAAQPWSLSSSWCMAGFGLGLERSCVCAPECVRGDLHKSSSSS